VTPEQAELWQQVGDADPQPSGEQTAAQAVNLQLDSFRLCCHLEGIPAPSEEEILARMNLPG
jgi:hypothetical protein